jgi:Domain of unknown function (DUF932)
LFDIGEEDFSVHGAVSYRRRDEPGTPQSRDEGLFCSKVRKTARVGRAVLEFFRDLTEAAGFTLETAGVLFGGKRFWALASIGAEAAIADPPTNAPFPHSDHRMRMAFSKLKALLRKAAERTTQGLWDGSGRSCRRSPRLTAGTSWPTRGMFQPDRKSL